MAPSSKFYDLNILFEQVLKSQKLWYVMNSEIKILVAFIKILKKFFENENFFLNKLKNGS